MKIMKNFILHIAAAVLILLAAPSISAAVYFDDAADLYESGEEAYIIQLMEEASASTGWNYGIVTLNEGHTTLSSAGKRAEQLYNDAFGVSSSGVLYMCDIDYRYFVIAGEAREYISGRRYQVMEDRIKELYFDYEDLSCATEFIRYTEKYYHNGKGSFALYTPALVISICCFVAGVILTIVAVTNRYHKHPKPQVNNYLDKRQIDIYSSHDNFIRETTVRYSESSSSGGRRGGGFGGSHGGGGFGGRR